ncbi:C25 family cysteine peptidase [Rudanella lutea]|uniref:putative type IX secretion system sortase PorU2 n=1 Tax=Rudanella lutea TaxID=451374 RepID=UPI00037608A3|nr:C25 family cysteine peptidase [Rudanella lutea]
MQWLLRIVLAFLTHSVFAQPTGDEWIRADQMYLKIPVARSATYQLTAAHLRRAGIDPAGVDPRTLQVLHHGREIPTSLTGDSDGRFDTGDTLLFEGHANDGTLDSALYRPAGAQPHSLYSLFSDTTFYFLTWRVGVQGLRQPVPDPSRPYRWTESRMVLTTDYAAGTIYPLGASLTTGSVLSGYDEGEGWTGPVINTGQSYSVLMPLSGVVWADSLPIRLQGWVVGRKNGSHRVVWRINGKQVAESRFLNYQTGRVELLLKSADWGLVESLTITVEPQLSGDQVSLSALQIEYAQHRTAAPVPAPELTPVRFRSFDNRRPNYLIVTHPQLRQPVGPVSDPIQAYAAYRASRAGGGYDTLTVDVNELFDRFTYGERSPLAIRRFAQSILKTRKPTDPAPMLFLVGSSRDPQGVRPRPGGPNRDPARLDLVPNGGWPGSDGVLVEGLNNEAPDVPGLPVGRLNTDSPATVLDYLAKVRAHESETPGLWSKRVLHLSGGQSSAELSRFRQYVDGLAAQIRQPPFGAMVQTFSKQTTAPVEVIPVAPAINDGIGLITLFGHAGLAVSDLDIGFASDDRRGYRNEGRHPFLLVNGCAAGNVFFGRPTFGTDWVTAPGRGAIGFLAHTHNGFELEMKAFAETFYAVLNDPHWLGEPVGRVQQETIRRYLRAHQSVVDRANVQQFLLQADPAIRLFRAVKPDYAFAPPNLLLQVPRSDSLLIRTGLTNAGRAVQGRLPVRVRQYTPEGQLLHEQMVWVSAPTVSDTVSIRVPRVSAQNLLVELRLNPAGEAEEQNTENNTLVLGGNNPTALPFPPDQMAPLLEVTFDGRPIENDDLVSPRPLITLRVLDDNPRLLRRDTTGLLLYLQRPDQVQTGGFERLWWQNATLTREGDGRAVRVDFRPAQPWPDGRYTLEAYASDLSGNRATPYRISFRVVREPGLMAAGVGPNPFDRFTRFFCQLSGSVPPQQIRLTLTDLSGRVVREVTLQGRIGTVDWLWDGTDAQGYRLPAGLYLYRFELLGEGAHRFLSTENRPLTGRVVLVR